MAGTGGGGWRRDEDRLDGGSILSEWLASVIGIHLALDLGLLFASLEFYLLPLVLFCSVLWKFGWWERWLLPPMKRSTALRV